MGTKIHLLDLGTPPPLISKKKSILVHMVLNYIFIIFHASTLNEKKSILVHMVLKYIFKIFHTHPTLPIIIATPLV